MPALGYAQRLKSREQCERLGHAGRVGVRAPPCDDGAGDACEYVVVIRSDWIDRGHHHFRVFGTERVEVEDHHAANQLPSPRRILEGAWLASRHTAASPAAVQTARLSSVQEGGHLGSMSAWMRA
jgi:hypothetical protein